MVLLLFVLISPQGKALSVIVVKPSLNTPLNLCSVCGGLGVVCLGEIHVGHAFRGCVKSDNTLDSRITTLELAFSRYISKISCVILLLTVLQH